MSCFSPQVQPAAKDNRMWNVQSSGHFLYHTHMIGLRTCSCNRNSKEKKTTPTKKHNSLISQLKPEEKKRPFPPCRHCATFGGVVVADLLDGLPDDLLVVHHSRGRDLTHQQDHPRLCHGLWGREWKTQQHGDILTASKRTDKFSKADANHCACCNFFILFYTTYSFGRVQLSLALSYSPFTKNNTYNILGCCLKSDSWQDGTLQDRPSGAVKSNTTTRNQLRAYC